MNPLLQPKKNVNFKVQKNNAFHMILSTTLLNKEFNFTFPDQQPRFGFVREDSGHSSNGEARPNQIATRH